MQVTAVSNKSLDHDPVSAANGSADTQNGDSGFAALFATLLAQAKEAGAAVAATPGDETTEASDTEATDEAPATGEAPATDATDDVAVALAMATLAPTAPAAPTPQPPTTAATEEDVAIVTTATTPVTTVSIEPPATTSSTEEVVEEVPVAPQAGAASTATPTVKQTVPKAVPAPEKPVEVPSPTPESAASYTVLPSPAQPVKAVASSEVAATVESASSSAPVTSTAAAMLGASNLGETATNDTDVDASAVNDDDADDSLLLAASKASNREKSAPATETVKETAPVLEKNTPMLARNALNEQLREHSSRELLASAREASPAAEKPAETAPANPMPLNDAARALNLRNPQATTHATAASSNVTVTTSLPELGTDLVKHVTLHAGPGERTLTMRLLPESLGEVRVEVTSHMDTVSVRLISQDASVRDALQQHASGLRDALARDGRETHIEIGSQLMSNMGQTHDGAMSNRQAQEQDAQERPRFLPQAFFSTEPAPAATARTERRVAEHAGSLNVFA